MTRQETIARALASAPPLLFRALEDFTDETRTRQAPNLQRMHLLGAEVRLVESGQRTLKDAINEALRDWVGDPDSHYVLGSALGPHPFPSIVADFQQVIGHEARAQMLERAGALPDLAVACVGVFIDDCLQTVCRLSANHLLCTLQARRELY